MAKDAKGHDSESRGGSYHNIDKNLNGPGKHVGYANGPWRIQKGQGAGYGATHAASGDFFSGKTLGAISKGLSDRASSMAYSRAPYARSATDIAAQHDIPTGHLSPDAYAKGLADRYHAEHGWSGDVGKHNGG